jgi:hypothetical protein
MSDRYVSGHTPFLIRIDDAIEDGKLVGYGKVSFTQAIVVLGRHRTRISSMSMVLWQRRSTNNPSQNANKPSAKCTPELTL